MAHQISWQSSSDGVAKALRWSNERPVIVVDEPNWRRWVAPDEDYAPRIRVGRSRSLGSGRHETATCVDPSCHVIGIALRCMDLRMEIDGRTMADGPVTPGMTSITEPGVSAACLFRGAYDVLHLYVPQALIAECGQDTPIPLDRSLPSGVSTVPNSVVHGLAMALLGCEQLGHGFSAVYADSLGLAIVARLMAPLADGGGTERSRLAPLPKWRLKRATDFIEANLSEPVSLAAMAESTGLTRMHFAAQFRAATGLPPHEYLLRRRVERAQEMLALSQTPVVEVALQVGFQSQAHFTSVFKRFAGFPPHAWRQRQRQAA